MLLREAMKYPRGIYGVRANKKPHSKEEFGANQYYCLAWFREYYAENSDRVKARTKGYAFQNKYGMSVEEVEDLKAAQGNVCAICGNSPDGRWKTLHVDHDHETNAVRALICSTCNMNLALVESDWIVYAITYLMDYGSCFSY